MDNSFNLYNKKLKRENKKDNKDSMLSRFFFSVLIKSLIVIVLFLGSLIFIRQSDKNKDWFKRVVYNNSLSFAKIYNIYNKFLGDALPFKNIFKDNTKVVSNEKMTYSNVKKENKGYVLDVSGDFTLFAVKSGIVVEKKKDKKYGNVIKIQDKNGLNITYGFLTDVEIKLYDYVEKGEILGRANNKLYLMFEKDGKYLSYEEYL